MSDEKEGGDVELHLMNGKFPLETRVSNCSLSIKTFNILICVLLETLRKMLKVISMTFEFYMLLVYAKLLLN